MGTIKENESLSKEEKMKRLEKAKGSKLCEGWRPYCMICNYNGRMGSTSYGFVCPICGNMIGFDMERLEESPLNNMTRRRALQFTQDYRRKVFHPCLGSFKTETIEWKHDHFVDDKGCNLSIEAMEEISQRVFDTGWKII